MTVYWSFELIENILGQADLAMQEELLGSQELTYLNSLHFEKRRVEWLAGRLALKKLLLATVPEFEGYEPAQLQLLKADSGAPYLQLTSDQSVSVSFSISHSNGFVLCAVTQQQILLGVDLEKIESRPDSFISDFFTQNEIEYLEHQSSQDRAFFSTLIWSGKEAALKAISVGLRIDTRHVEIELGKHSQLDDWQCDRVTVSNEKTLHLNWRRVGDFVITISGENIESKELIQKFF